MHLPDHYIAVRWSRHQHACMYLFAIYVVCFSLLLFIFVLFIYCLMLYQSVASLMRKKIYNRAVYRKNYWFRKCIHCNNSLTSTARIQGSDYLSLLQLREHNTRWHYRARVIEKYNVGSFHFKRTHTPCTTLIFLTKGLTAPLLMLGGVDRV